MSCNAPDHMGPPTCRRGQRTWSYVEHPNRNITYMHGRVALWTPLGDAGSCLYLEVHVDVDLAVLLAGVLDHAPQGLFIVGLAPAAHVVHGGLAVKSATARAVEENAEKAHT